MTSVSATKRLGYGLIDIAVYTSATLWLAGQFGWAPRMQFMQAYSASEQQEYWAMLWLAVAVVAAGSIAGHALWGRSLGKWLFGARTVTRDGSALGLTGALRRVSAMLAVLATIVLPGPLVGFALGPGSEAISMGLLLAALIAVPLLTVRPWHKDGSPWLQHRIGVCTIDSPR